MLSTLDRRFLDVMEQIAELDQAARDEVLDTFLDIIDPLLEPRPASDAERVADGRAILAAYDRGFTAALDEIDARRGKTPEQAIIDAVDEAQVVDWILRETERRGTLVEAALEYVTSDTSNDRVVVLDDGQESGVQVERHDDDEGPSWLDFEAGRLAIGVSFGVSPAIEDGPVAVALDGSEVAGPWMLDDLRRLHRDLGRILADPRLPGALDEAWGYYNQAEQEARS